MILAPVNIQEIRDLVKGRVQTQAPLHRLTSLRIGGPADLVVEPENTEELGSLLCYLDEKEIDRVILGAGTNVLFQDSGFRGVVIRIISMEHFSVSENGAGNARIGAGAGLGLPSVIKKACALGFRGIEPLWGIPGSFGGAIVTNAGAGGLCLGDLLSEIRLLSRGGQEMILEKERLDYGYRSMTIPDGAVVVEGTVHLTRGKPRAIEAALEKARTKRRSSQPLGVASAGCVFKNPDPDNPAGALIDRLGFKGVSVGAAQVSDVHANFIINRGDASALQVLELIERMRSKVKSEYGFDLDLEIRIIGD